MTTRPKGFTSNRMLTIDTLARNELVANGTAQYAGTSNTATNEVATADYITANEILKALATVEAADGRPMDGGNFVGIMHPKTKYQMMQDSTVMNTFLHATPADKQNPLYTHKWGEWMGIDWFVTSNAYISTAGGEDGQDVYSTLIIARDGYGCGGLAGDIPSSFGSSQQDPNTGETINPVSLKVVTPTPSASDPLGQRGSVGWITTFVPKVLNANWVLNLEHSNSI